MPPWLINALELLSAIGLVILNGFFVAAEFALVKVRPSQVDKLVSDKRPFAKSAKFLSDRLEASLSSCQLGITIASLALGWVAEPAFAEMLRPVFEWMGVSDESTLHMLTSLIVFPLITALHLVIGEQAPKIFAIRRPEVMLIWCALPMRFFFLVGYPFMVALNQATSFLLGLIGLTNEEGHETALTEEELRVMLQEAHLRGHVTRSEHRLINAVFEFDDMVCRAIMVPRNDVEYFDVNEPVSESVDLARRTKHTRYPICDGGLDEVLGVIHIKDLVGLDLNQSFDWRSIMRPPKKVPENMLISKLLRHFQATHQLLAFVIDEFGNTIGIVTLENVLETIIGSVDDEFDEKQTDIVPTGKDQYLINGSTPINIVAAEIGFQADDSEADTFSGYLTQKVERMLSRGDIIKLENAVAEVIEVRDDRATSIRVTKVKGEQASEAE